MFIREKKAQVCMNFQCVKQLFDKYYLQEDNEQTLDHQLMELELPVVPLMPIALHLHHRWYL